MERSPAQSIFNSPPPRVEKRSSVRCRQVRPVSVRAFMQIREVRRIPANQRQGFVWRVGNSQSQHKAIQTDRERTASPDHKLLAKVLPKNAFRSSIRSNCFP